MRDENLDNAIVEHYHKQTLTPAALVRMEMMAESMSEKLQYEQKTGFWHKRWQQQKNLSIAAMFVIAMLLIPIFWQSGDTLLQRVAREVALNHNKQLESDYVSDSYKYLASVMERLDFLPAASVLLQKNNYQITGARYCSIQGQIAAQIKLVSPVGGVLTLYQTRLNDELAILDNQHYTINNVQVKNWQEDGIFYSLARTIH